MKATLNWLRDFVDIEMDVYKLSNLLTMSGLEVEDVIKLGEGLEKVVVGEILEVNQHPEDEKLFVATVYDGTDKLKIVSAAPNTNVGLKTALAHPGLILPNGMKVDKRKFKGVESIGVLLAEDEMGLTHDHTGLIELPKDAKHGRPITEILDISDYLLDIGISPNRADCLSILGLARDISAITDVPLRHPKVKIIEKGPDISGLTSVEVIDADLCPRYSVRVIQDIKIRQSPLWMRMRLCSLDVRDINNIVDITNYVMLEYGQPLHAFDYNLLCENRIVVRRANVGEKFFTLDAIERELDPEVLMICDGEKSIAIGGVMGGANSEIQDDTETVLLESAHFHPPSIYKTARGLGLPTEASFRFERGVDPEGTIAAADRAAGLMAELADGIIAKGVIDVKGNIPKRPVIKIRTERTKKIIGFDVTTKEIEKCLKRLLIEVVDKKSDSISAKPPSYRLDLEREIDLIEEVARLVGYDKIPETLPEIDMDYSDPSTAETVMKRVSQIMISEGFNEIITYSFIGSDAFDLMRLDRSDPKRRSIRLRNPMSEDMAIMRTTLLPGIIKAAVSNMNHLNFDLSIFEVSRVFIPKNGEKLPDETYHLSALSSGRRNPRQWGSDSEEVDFFDIKGVWETIIEKLGILGVDYGRNISVPYLDPSESCEIRSGDEIVGVMGKIDDDVMRNFDLSRDAYVMEVNLTRLADLETHEVAFVPIPRYPPIMRDIALLVEKDVKSKEIVNTIEGTVGEIIKDINIFDIYIGKQVEEGKKSIALTVKYQSGDRTLTDEEVNDIHKKVIDVLEERLDARIR